MDARSCLRRDRFLHNLPGWFALLFTVTVLLNASLVRADEIDYSGVISEGEGAWFILLPAGTRVEGPLNISITPGGTTTDPAVINGALLLFSSPETGGNLFCFSLNSTCPPDSTLVSIVAVPAVNLNFANNGCPVDGFIEFLAFSPTLSIELLITIDITENIFRSEVDALGFVAGFGGLNCDDGFSEIEASPNPATAIDFGDIALGAPVPPQVITISNVGTSNLNMGSVFMTGNGGFLIDTDTCSNSAIAVMGTCQIVVTAMPATLGALVAELHIPSDDADENPISYSLVANVVAGQISIDAPLVINDTEIGTSMSGIVTIVNIGLGTLNVGQIETSNLLEPFSFGADMCSFTAIPPNGSCTVEVVFSPSIVGLFTDSFTIVSDDPDPVDQILSVSVSAVAVNDIVPIVQFSNTLLALPAVDPGQVSFGTITVSNVGSADLVVNSIGELAAPFSLASETCSAAPLVAGSSCALNIEFLSFIIGDFTDTFTFDSNDAGGVHILSVAGSATPTDIDGDGVPNAMVNCTLVANADQRDTNNDGYGNICDPDITNDGVVNYIDVAMWIPFFNTLHNGDQDFNGDGAANFADYALFPSYFLQPPGPSGLAGNVFEITTPLPNTEIDLDSNQTVTLQWMEGNVPVVGEAIAFSTTRGTLSPSTAFTTSNGEASVNISSLTSGFAQISASAFDGSTATLDIEFIATNPASIELLANPVTVYPNGQSEIAAIVRDPNGNLVKNATVLFDLTDPTPGFLSMLSDITDSQGRAHTLYTASFETSDVDAITVTATVDDTALEDEVALTVAHPQVFFEFLVGPAIIEPNPAQYQQPVVMKATDSDGQAMANLDVTINVRSTNFKKGYWCFASPATDWFVTVADNCDDEDSNQNGILDPGEDLNGNGFIDAGAIAVAIPGAFSTDENGFSVLDIFYPQAYGEWLEVELEASASVRGVVFSEQSTFLLRANPADLDDETIAPPAVLVVPENFVPQSGKCQINALAQSLFSSPFGYNSNCAVFDFPLLNSADDTNN